MGAEATSSASDLKRLEFLRTYTGYFVGKGYDLAFTLYSNGKSYAPARIEPAVKAVEDKVTEYGTPLVNIVQDQSESILKTLDTKVDTVMDRVVNFAENSIGSQAKLHEKGAEFYRHAREMYLKRVEEVTSFLKENGLTGTAKFAAEVVLARVDEAKKLPSSISKESKVLVEKVGEAWARLSSYPAVHNVIETAQPSVDFAWKKYIAAHDTVVATQTYHRAVETGAGVLSKVQETGLYKAAADKLYPVVSPYFDPALDRVTHSHYYEAVRNHLKPIDTPVAKQVAAN
jgi:hypothetical protein